MATTTDVKVTPGTGANVAAYAITEDAETKVIQRVVLSDNTGADINFATQAVSPTPLSLTRTADTNAYTANDVIGSATTSGGAALDMGVCGVSGADVLITSVAFEIDVTAVISGMANYRLYLYNVTPPSALGDNAAWDLTSGDRASYLGYVDLGTPVDLGSTLYVEVNGVNKHLKLLGTHLFAYLVTTGAYTPSSAMVHKITLHTLSV
jgi:hypothetical protein